MIKVLKKKYPLKKKILSNKVTRYSEIIKIVSEWSEKNWLDFYHAVVFEELGGYFCPLTIILLLPLYPFFYFFYARNFSWQAKKHYGIDIKKDVNANQILELKKAMFLATIDSLVDLATTEKLKFNWDEVHEVAEQLEHIKSRRMIERLDEFLEYPKFDPHGDPIPDEEGKIYRIPAQPLAEAPLQEVLKVVSVNDGNPDLLKYLDKVGISIGCQLKIIDKVSFDGSLELEINGKSKRLVSRQVSENILVID